MSDITQPYLLNGRWEVKITRRNKKFYIVSSEDKQSIIEYRDEFLQAQQQRLKQKQR